MKTIITSAKDPTINAQIYLHDIKTKGSGYKKMDRSNFSLTLDMNVLAEFRRRRLKASTKRKISQALKGKRKKAPSVKGGAIKGAKIGAALGGTVGGLSGAAGGAALGNEAAGKGGAIAGGLGGGAVGGATGAIRTGLLGAGIGAGVSAIKKRNRRRR